MTDVGPHLLGRFPSPPDGRDYRLAAYLPAAPPILTRSWRDRRPVLNQGAYGTCVGHGWAQWATTDPVSDRYEETDARAIYYEATVIDGQPDDPDAPGGGQQGSTVRSGAKAMRARGRLAAYAFASSLDDVAAWISQHGPVVMGTDWHRAMFTPAASGLVVPAGPVEGGHCYLLRAVRPSLKTGATLEDALFGFLNSWGAGWGLRGRFYMRGGDLASLLTAGGEACAAAELPRR